MRYTYVNGSYLRYNEASIHIEDRGFQFADGVYEVIGCIHGHLADERGHLDRLVRSLKELGMNMPVSRKSLQLIIREVLRKNSLSNAFIYIQITRGVSPRNFPFPTMETPQTLVVTARYCNFDTNPNIKTGVSVITTPDIRWKRPDIKSIALLPQALAKQKASEANAFEAWMIDDKGYITEGAASNAWIIDKKGTIITRSAIDSILKGVTRNAILDLSKEQGIKIKETPFTPKQAYNAEEAFYTSATGLVTPVVKIDGQKIGNGKPGPITKKLYAAYRDYVDDLKKEQIPWSA